jgi:hypothetical protein
VGRLLERHGEAAGGTAEGEAMTTLTYADERGGGEWDLMWKEGNEGATRRR